MGAIGPLFIGIFVVRMKNFLSILIIMICSCHQSVADTKEKVLLGEINQTIVVFTVFDPVEKDVIAEIKIVNQLTSGHKQIHGYPFEQVMFNLNGEKLRLVFQPMDDNIPDLAYVSLPDNYFAEPSILLLNENTSGVIKIYRHLCC